MNTTIIILLVIAVAALLMSFLWLFAPQHKDSVNIHLDKDTKMNISKGEDGVHIALVGPGGSTPMESDLFPQVEMEIAPPTPFTRDFWLKVAHLEELEMDERRSLCDILFKHNIISDSEREFFLTPGGFARPGAEPGAEESAEPKAPWEENPEIVEPDENAPLVYEEDPEIDDISDNDFNC